MLVFNHGLSGLQIYHLIITWEYLNRLHGFLVLLRIFILFMRDRLQEAAVGPAAVTRSLGAPLTRYWRVPPSDARTAQAIFDGQATNLLSASTHAPCGPFAVPHRHYCYLRLSSLFYIFSNFFHPLPVSSLIYVLVRVFSALPTPIAWNNPVCLWICILNFSLIQSPMSSTLCD